MLSRTGSNFNLANFQKLTNNMNVVAGCPMFTSTEKFITEHFDRENCACIKTTHCTKNEVFH